jgi:HSP20 family protein
MEMDGDAEKGEKGESPETMREDVPDPAEVAPEEDGHPPHHHGRGGRRGFGRGNRGGWGGGCRGRRFGHHGPPPPGVPPFDFAGMIRGFSQHPFFQNLREQAENYRAAAAATQNNDEPSDESDAFVPPVDIFSTERAYVLHVALPGAKKEDIGVNWDADSSVLNIAGVVYRPGDEEFLKSLSSGERKIGMFERNVKLPPAGAEEKDEIDGFGITARMEDGILIITVPKVEKEWTEIRKVDIE